MEIYGRQNATNVIPVLWTLDELGLPYHRHDAGGSFGVVDTPAFRALNPNGRVPVMDDAGFVLWESNAIVRYLAETHGEGTLRSPDNRDRARADQWMEWYKTTFYPPFIALFQSFVRIEPEERDPQRIDDLATTVADLLQIPDAVLRARPFLAGERFSIGDIPLGVAIHRYMSLPIARPPREGIDRWYAHLRERAPYQSRVMRPFGLTPADFRALEQAGRGDR